MDQRSPYVGTPRSVRDVRTGPPTAKQELIALAGFRYYLISLAFGQPSRFLPTFLIVLTIFPPMIAPATAIAVGLSAFISASTPTAETKRADFAAVVSKAS